VFSKAIYTAQKASFSFNGGRGNARGRARDFDSDAEQRDLAQMYTKNSNRIETVSLEEISDLVTLD